MFGYLPSIHTITLFLASIQTCEHMSILAFGYMNMRTSEHVYMWACVHVSMGAFDHQGKACEHVVVKAYKHANKTSLKLNNQLYIWIQIFKTNVQGKYYVCQSYKKREENKLCNHSLIKSLITKLNARIYFQTLWGLFSYVCPDMRLN